MELSSTKAAAQGATKDFQDMMLLDSLIAIDVAQLKSLFMDAGEIMRDLWI